MPALAQFVLISLYTVYSLADDNIKSLDPIFGKIKDHKSNLSYYIGENPDTILYQNEPDKAFIPASVTKLITSVVVLDEMGPATRLVTKIKARKVDIKGDVLAGHICLLGAGDPSFVSENMWILVNNFVRSGIKIIRGDIIVDDSLFDWVAFDETRLKTRVDRAYDAPVGAMSFNWNSMNIYVRPNEEGKKAHVILDPIQQSDLIENQVITNSKPTQITVSKVVNGHLDKVIVKGNINKDSEEKLYFIPVTNPALWSGNNLKIFLAQRGVVVHGIVRQGLCASDSSDMAISESKPIEQMVKDMNKFSNNFVAEMLVKLLASQTKTRASLQDGVKHIQVYLKKKGFTDKDIKISNPSGLTRDNFVSARSLWKLLFNAQADLRINGEFLSSLPLAGIDGTLKNRMKDIATLGRIRAKTGYINGVVSLSGYYSNRQNKIIPFVFLYNGIEDEAKVRSLIDKALIYLARH